MTDPTMETWPQLKKRQREEQATFLKAAVRMAGDKSKAARLVDMSVSRFHAAYQRIVEGKKQ